MNRSKSSNLQAHDREVHPDCVDLPID